MTSPDFKFLLNNSRSRVYLLWATALAIGYVATQKFQRESILWVWLILTVIPMYYMYRVMPLRVKQMRAIYWSWLTPLLIGFIVSFTAFKIPSVTFLVPYLGVFWLFIMAIGFAANGIVDPPTKYYSLAAVANILVALICLFWLPALRQQYLLSAVVASGSMLLLWFTRT